MTHVASSITSSLSQHQLKPTRWRRIVIELLALAPRTTKQLTSTLTDLGSHPTTVYRTLETLQAKGLIREVMINQSATWDLCEPLKAHHHHFSCTLCGQVQDIELPTVEAAIIVAATQQGLTMTTHLLELTGLCSDCTGNRLN